MNSKHLNLSTFHGTKLDQSHNLPCKIVPKFYAHHHTIARTVRAGPTTGLTELHAQTDYRDGSWAER